MIRQVSVRSFLFKFHIQAGVVLAFLIILLTVTGIGLLMLRPSPAQEMRPDISLITKRVKDLSGQLRERQPDSRIIFILGDPAKGEHISFRTRTDSLQKLAGSKKHIYHLDSGLPVQKSGSEKGSWDVIRKNLIDLHRSLFLGANGKLLIGVVAGIYLLVLGSGVLILSLPFMRFFRSLRKQGFKKALTASSLHQLTGVLLFPWALTVGVSGLLLGFSKPISGWYQDRSWTFLTSKVQDSEQNISDKITPGDMIKKATDLNPGFDFWYLAYPGNDYAPDDYFTVTLKGSPHTGAYKQKTVFFNAKNGQYIEETTPWYMAFFYWARAFHFGDTGGLFMKLFWGLVATISLLIPVSGLKMWRRV